jgi:hypothetical protein
MRAILPTLNLPRRKISLFAPTVARNAAQDNHHNHHNHLNHHDRANIPRTPRQPTWRIHRQPIRRCSRVPFMDARTLPFRPACYIKVSHAIMTDRYSDAQI